MIKSKKKWFLFLIKLIGSCLLIYFGVKEISTNFWENGLSIGKLLFSGAIGIMGLFNLTLLLISYEIEVTESELVKKSIFGFYRKKTQRKRIESFAEFNFETEYLYSKSLFLLGDNINIEISSIEISNYEELKREVVKGLNEDKTYKQSTEEYFNRIGIVVLIFMLITVFGYKIIGN